MAFIWIGHASSKLDESFYIFCIPEKTYHFVTTLPYLNLLFHNFIFKNGVAHFRDRETLSEIWINKARVRVEKAKLKGGNKYVNIGKRKSQVNIN
jgi:hypothetical protein